MKIRLLIVVVAVIAVLSCQRAPEYPKTIGKAETFEAPSTLVDSLGVVGVFSRSYHLEGGYSKDRGKTLICRSRDKQYSIAFYRPAEAGFVLVGTPVPFGQEHPVGTVYNDRPAFKGRYKGKERIVYMDSGQLVIRDSE